ncbi:hypothetical protein [Acinetobacter boissieri]|uniref:hypothetical protein n=1 Tax=Acinetobacter boissieri TaxID=1219383 RepID=UPI00148A2486|nr:hypothetical protein [Acinetobacter boissieri]
MQDQSYVIRGLSQDPKEGWVERRIDGSGWIWHKSHTTYHFEAVAKDPHRWVHMSTFWIETITWFKWSIRMVKDSNMLIKVNNPTN